MTLGGEHYPGWPLPTAGPSHISCLRRHSFSFTNSVSYLFFFRTKIQTASSRREAKTQKEKPQEERDKNRFFFNLTNTMHSASQQISERAVVASDELIVVNKCTTKYRRPEYPTKYWHDKDVTGRDMTGK